MKALLDITYQLRDIFGWETELVESFGLTSRWRRRRLRRGHLGRRDQRRGGRARGAARPRSEDQPRHRRDGQAGGPPWINIAPTADFERINVVQPLAVDPVLQAELAARVQRPANLMRRFFDELGLARVRSGCA